MKNQFKITFFTYSVTLTLTSILIAIFCAAFFQGYFNPNFVAEYRSSAQLGTVLGFIKGINPFQEEYVEEYGNLYSVLWPGAVYLIAKLFGLVSYNQIRLLMYALNAIIVTGTAAAAFYVARRNKLNALLALIIGFTYLLLNSTKISMGEFSYSAGLSCSFLALVLVSNKFDRSGLCMALALITLASLFKTYFALLGIVIAFNSAAFLPLRSLISILCAWGVATAALFFGLTRVFPFYFDSILMLVLPFGWDEPSVYLMHKLFQSRDARLIASNIWWFLTHFGFIFILTFPQLVRFKRQATEEKRRQMLYAAGSLIVCIYVLLVMLPYQGNFGTYLLHIIAPIILAYALSRSEEFAPELDRWTGQIAALGMCMVVFINPTFRSSPLQRWKEYGVLWRDDLRSNRNVLMEATNVIRSSGAKEIYVDPVLAPLAIKSNLKFVDTGNRGLYEEYVNARRNGTLKLSPLISWLAAPKPGGTERPGVVWGADLVVCTRCPDERTHRFVRDLGVLTTAFNGPFVVKLYYKNE